MCIAEDSATARQLEAAEQGCKAIIDKQMVFTVYQPAAPQGAEAAKAAIELAKGGTLDNFDTLSEDKLHLWIPFEKVDETNAQDYIK